MATMWEVAEEIGHSIFGDEVVVPALMTIVLLASDLKSDDLSTKRALTGLVLTVIPCSRGLLMMGKFFSMKRGKVLDNTMKWEERSSP